MILEVKNGSFTYPESDSPVFQDISFQLNHNSIMTILGKNGIGKTTLLKCIMGIYKWSSGNTILDGKVINSTEQFKNIAYVPQAHGISYPYSAHQLVTMGRFRHMGTLSIPSKRDKEIAAHAIRDVGMEHLLDRPCNRMSGGQLQLIFIARALAAEPDILIMDEPESNLDFKNQYLMLELIQRLASDKKISCIINTHYPEHALRISDQTLILSECGYLHGSTSSIITEENIRSFFDVNAKIGTLQYENETVQTFTVVNAIER